MIRINLLPAREAQLQLGRLDGGAGGHEAGLAGPGGGLALAELLLADGAAGPQAHGPLQLRGRLLDLRLQPPLLFLGPVALGYRRRQQQGRRTQRRAGGRLLHALVGWLFGWYDHWAMHTHDNQARLLPYDAPMSPTANPVLQSRRRISSAW